MEQMVVMEISFLCSWMNIMQVLKNGHGTNGHGIEQMVEMWFGN